MSVWRGSKEEVIIQADNLRPEDTKKLSELCEKIKEENPDIRYQTFVREKFRKKDCIFKDRCKK